MSNAAEEEKIKKKVRETFEEFIENFSSDAVEAALSSGAESVGHDYLDQCRQMASNERSTLYVDFRHVQQHQSDLADAIQAEYYHFEPTLRDALREVMRREHAEYATDDKDFVVNFFNMPVQQCIRDLRTDKIAKLISFQGTVTRTSEVRPELLVAVFQCELCGARSDPVEQQFKYSEPVKCKNASCPNQKEWKLLSSTEGTKFVDWQRVRVQENVAEIPAGSMPLTMDVILRGENVERAKAGNPIEQAKLAKDATTAFNSVYEYAAAIRAGTLNWEDVEKADFNTRLKWVGPHASHSGPTVPTVGPPQAIRRLYVPGLGLA